MVSFFGAVLNLFLGFGLFSGFDFSGYGPINSTTGYGPINKRSGYGPIN